MSKLGGLYYEITLKDSTSKGLTSIERRIKRMSATISPKISAPDLNRQIKDATSKLKVANIQVNVTANTANLGANIQTAVNAGTYVAKIGADTNGLIANIQEAINKATFTAKVAKVDINNGGKGSKATEQKVTIKADTSELASSIQKAIGSQAYVAKINADTTGFISAIQTAIASSAFTAKVNLDKSTLTSNASNKKSAEAKTTNAAIKDTTYSVDVKARATSLRQSIKDSIAKGEFKVAIETKVQVLRQSIKNAITNGVFKANISANIQTIKKSITDALASASFKANVSANVQSFNKSIRDALAASDYKAKIAADTTLLAGAIQRQINQQTFTAKVTLTSQSATTDKKKKSEEVTNTKTKKRKDEPIKITVDASSAPKTIQTAIDSKPYTAKIGANTEALVKAIENAIPKEKNIKINGTVSTSGSTSNGSKGGSTPPKISDSEIKKIQAQAAKTAQVQGVSEIKGNAIKFYTDRINEQTNGLNDLEAKLKRVNALIARKGSASGIDNALVERLEARRKAYTSDLAHLENARAKIESKNNWTDESLRAQMTKSSESYMAAQIKAKNKAEEKAHKERDKALSDYQSTKAKNAVTGQIVSQNIQNRAAKADAQALKDEAKNLQQVIALRNQAAKEQSKIEAEEAKQARKSRENDIRAALAEKDRKDKANSQALKAQTASLSDRLNERANLKAQTERQQKLDYYRDRINEYERGVKELQARMARLQSLSFKRGDSSQLTSEAIKRAQSRIELYHTKIAGLSDEMNKISLGKWDGKTDHTNRQIELEKAFANQVAAQEKANRDREKLIEKYKAETAKNYERGLRNAQNIASKRNNVNTSVANKGAESTPTRNFTSPTKSASNTQNQSRILSEDEKNYIRDLRQRLREKAETLKQRIDGYGKKINLGRSLGDLYAGSDKRFVIPNFVEDAKKQLANLEALYDRFNKMSRQSSLPIPKMRSLDGYGSIPSNHAEMQKKWEAHFAWKDELAAQEKSKRAEEARVAAIKAATEQRKQAAASARNYATEMQRVASEFQNVGNKGGWLRDQLQNVFSMYGVQQFLQNLIMIGGEFEKQRIALGSIFKNTEKGNELFGQVKQWSVKSPFTFSQLSSYTKQLASFGFQYRDVLDTTKKLADISAGVGVDMGRVILAYGQVFTAKYLRGQELRQFTEAGIPMVDELSKVLTERMHKNVSTGDVFKLISDKQVKFEDVEKVINKITGEGGTFYKMQEKQSESLAGRWTNLKDAVEIMYSDIETSNNGILKGGVAMLTKLALAWKGVFAAVTTVVGAYGILAMKNRIVSAATAFNVNAIANVNSHTAAVQKQVDAYNQLASAITRKNTQESVRGGSGNYHSSVTWRERIAARDMATRAALNGASPRELTPIYTGERRKTVNEYGHVVWDKNAGLDKSFQKGGSVEKANKLVRTIKLLKIQTEGSASATKRLALGWNQAHLAVWKAGLSLKAFAANMAATAASMLPFIAISGAISGIMYLIQSKNEAEEKNKEFIEGAKSSYKELYDFIEANPIEIAIKKGDRDELRGLIDDYEKEARNSPINIDFAITQSKNISDMGERLDFLKRKLQEVAEAEMWLKDHSLGLNNRVEEDTNGWFDDAYYTNIKQYEKAKSELQAEISQKTKFDMQAVLKGLEYNIKNASNKDVSKQYKALHQELSALANDGNITAFFEKYYSWNGNIHESEAHRNFRLSKQDKDEDADAAYQDFRKTIEGNSKALFNGGLTDFGHDLLVGWAKNFGQAHDMMDSEVNQMIADLEQRSKPAINSVWQNNTQSMNALVDQIKANCANLFEGSDISNGLSKQQKDAIQQIIRNAPAECKQYTSEWQRLLDANKLTMTIGVRFNMSGLPGYIPSSLQESFDRNVGSGDGNKYGAYRPEEGQDFDSYNQARSSSLNKRKKEIENLKAVKNKTQAQKDDLKKQQQEQANEEYAFKNTSPFGYAEYEEKANKKDKQAEAKAQREKEKAQRDKEKKQREYESSLRKEFQQIKRVKDMYEKLRGLYGDVGALEQIRKSGLVKADIIPTDVTNLEQFMKKYEAIMKKFKGSIKGNSDAIKEIKDQVSQDLFNLIYDKDKEALDKAVSTLETQLERAGDAWKRYKDLLSEGIDAPLANLMAFGDMQGSQSYLSDETGTQRLDYLRAKAQDHITNTAHKDVSDTDMDRILVMNEEEIKTEFGNNEEVTKGLWTIVKAYQDVAKTIRSENDKLISQLYKDSLSYAGQMESIARKHKQERITIQSKGNAYAPAKERYDRDVQQGVNIDGRLKYQQGLANTSKEYKAWSLANSNYDSAKDSLAMHDQQVKEGKKPKTSRKDLQKRVNDAKANADKAWNIYINTDAYKGIAPLEKEQAKNAEEQKIAKEKLSDTLPPDVANGLLAQSKINERNEKSDASIKMLEGSDGYIQLFNNIYNLASKTANEIADNLIATLDEKLANGEITQEDYNKVRGEISSHRNEVYEKGTDGKNASLWQVGFGGITKNQIQQSDAAKNTAGAMMESISRQMDDIDADTTMSSADKLGKKGLLQSQYNQAKADYEKADKEGNQAAKKQAKQDMIQGGFGMAANMGQNLTQFRDTLGGTLDAFGIDTENNEGFQKFSTAVDVMSDVSSGMSNAMQSMMSGDFVGAAFSIIETPMNISNAFAKLHDKKLDIQINQSKELMEEVKTASEDLKNAIQDSLGAEDAKSRALSRQGEMAQILSDAGVKDTEGAGFVYGMVSGKTSGSALINQNRNKYYGKDGKVTDQEYRKVFSFGKFLGNTLSLGTSTAIGAIPATGYTTYKAISGATTLKRNEEAKAFDRMADALEKAQFGKHDQVSVYGAEYASLLEQRKQAEYQMKMEQDKSNTDDDKIKEYKNQIKELTQQIHEYMTNLAKELYGIDFSSWANKLGDALTNAFRNGEDAAAAFHDTVSDIMADLVKNILITDAIKPMFSKLETTLFGKDGDGSGMLDMNDMEGSIKKAVPYITDFFNQVENSVPGWQQLYDVLDEASGGIVKKTSSSSSSLSGSIKGITEETSTLLASYINAIRLDVSVNRNTLKDLAEVTIPKMSVIAENQLRQLNVIAEQTTKIEENTRKNYETVDLIRSYISSVSTTTSGGKAIRVK